MKRDREKNYLERIRTIDNLIVDLQEDANNWRNIAASLGCHQTDERVQTSRVNNSMNALSVALDIERDIARLWEERREIVKVITSLPAPESGVLYKKYVLGMDYYKIADTFNNKSYSWATSVHGRGLQMVKKILDEMEEIWQSENVK